MVGKVKKIVILTHAAHPLHSQRYLLRLVAAQWQEGGIEVKELCGLDRFEGADMAVQHVNLTVVPEEYVRFGDRYPVVINRRALDISKSRISTNLVGPEDGYPGPVIVKSNLNFGGCPEEALRAAGPRWKEAWGKLRELAFRFAPLTAKTRTLKRYPIFPSLRQVPEAVFANPHLVVEKFLPELRDGCYWLRKYVFLGDRHAGIRSAARTPIVKSASSVSHETIPIPPELHAMRARLGFDYGKFDYVVHDGQIALFDVNRTPTYGRAAPTARLLAIARDLAEGILSFTPAGRTAGIRRDRGTLDRRRCA